jgi:plastocyanin
LTRRSSSCCRRRSDLRPAVAVACLIVAVGLPAAAAAGTVEGAVSVERASVRSDGPKHDLDVVVTLEPVSGTAPAPAAGAASMDQKGLVFVPHVLAIPRGTTVTFLNSDNEQHNVYFLDDRTGETLDIGTWGRGVSVDHTFDTAGLVITLCKLHLEMAAYIVVVDTPWFAHVELDPSTRTADYRIDGVPAGEYELTVWHKKLKQKGGVQTISVAADGTTRADAVITRARFASAGR